MPPVGSLGTEDEGKNAESGDTAEDGCQVGTEAHGLQELSHACTFLGTHSEYADDGQDDTDSCDEHRSEDGLGLHCRTGCIEGRSAEGHCGKDGSAITLIEVCAHAGDVTDIVTYVVCDCGRIARVVLRKI